MAETFRQWMAEHKVSGGAMAVSYAGEEVLAHGFGRDVAAAYPLASLSKVITAVCLQQLLDERQQSMSMPLNDAIPSLLATTPPADPQLAKVTLGQLVSHNSGIHSRYHRDFIVDTQSFTQVGMKRQFAALAANKMAAAPGSGYHYSNANYLLAGLAIEELSGQSYEPYCNENLLQPAGVDAKLYPRWRVMSSWGGWQMSAPDFLKFLNRYFADSKVLGKSPTLPLVNTPVGNGGVFYGLGTFTRSVVGGARFWHAGSWRWSGHGRDDRFGAYFLTREDGLMVAVNYADHAQGDKLNDLQNRLVRAMKL
jgi:CubicO group peptidase (beta-lactamase class C family)